MEGTAASFGSRIDKGWLPPTAEDEAVLKKQSD